MGVPAENEPHLSAKAFMAWYEQQPGGRRYELLAGRVYEMQGERAIHGRLKGRIFSSFERQIQGRNLPCEAFVDGMAVRADEDSIFEPDVLLRCGKAVPDDDTVLMDDPMVVVEVFSPSSQRVDCILKLASYFRNPSIIHYLMVIPATRTILHHRRRPDGLIVLTQARDTGLLQLEPPGMEIDLADVFRQV